MHRKIPTGRPGAPDVAKWLLAAFPSAVLVAFVLYPTEVFPWLAKVLEVLK